MTSGSILVADDCGSDITIFLRNTYEGTTEVDSKVRVKKGSAWLETDDSVCRGVVSSAVSPEES